MICAVMCVIAGGDCNLNLRTLGIVSLLALGALVCARIDLKTRVASQSFQGAAGPRAGIVVCRDCTYLGGTIPNP